MDGSSHCSKIPLYFRFFFFRGGKETKGIRAAERDGATKATAPDAPDLENPRASAAAGQALGQCDADGTAGTRARPIGNADRKATGGSTARGRENYGVVEWSGVE